MHEEDNGFHLVALELHEPTFQQRVTVHLTQIGTVVLAAHVLLLGCLDDTRGQQAGHQRKDRLRTFPSLRLRLNRRPLGKWLLRNTTTNLEWNEFQIGARNFVEFSIRCSVARLSEKSRLIKGGAVRPLQLHLLEERNWKRVSL